eukprot:532023_1
MAPLSRMLVGKVLPHDHYGSHLSHGKVTDEEICLQNFNYAGRLLAKQWNGHFVDGHPTFAEYIPPLTDEGYESVESEFDVSNEILHKFYATHGQLNTYSIQIKNCLNNECEYCLRDKYLSNIGTMFSPILLPPPICVVWNGNKLMLKKPEDMKETDHFLDLNAYLTLPLHIQVKDIPFETYNAEFVGKDWNAVKCPFCPNKYFSSKAAMLRHRRGLHFRQRAPKENRRHRRGLHFGQRAPKENRMDLGQLLDQTQQKEIGSVYKVLLQDRSRYLCEFNDKTVRWIALDKQHAKVKEYVHILKTRLSEPTRDGLPLLTDNNWEKYFMSPFIFDQPEILPETEKTNVNVPQVPSFLTSNIGTVEMPAIPTISDMNFNVKNKENINHNMHGTSFISSLPALF